MQRIIATLLLFLVVLVGLIPTTATAATPPVTLTTAQADALKFKATIQAVQFIESNLGDELLILQTAFSNAGISEDEMFRVGWRDVPSWLKSRQAWNAYLANLRECQRVKALAQQLPSEKGNRLMKVWAALGQEAWAVQKPFTQCERFGKAAVQPPLKQFKQHLAGNALRFLRNAEIARKLPLKHPVHALHFLLLAQLNPVVGQLDAQLAMLPRRK
jgi:hypothetical protein